MDTGSAQKLRDLLGYAETVGIKGFQRLCTQVAKQRGTRKPLVSKGLSVYPKISGFQVVKPASLSPRLCGADTYVYLCGFICMGTIYIYIIRVKANDTNAFRVPKLYPSDLF